MIRSLASMAAEGSPAGDAIRSNDTLVGGLCIGVVIAVVLWLSLRGKK